MANFARLNTSNIVIDILNIDDINNPTEEAGKLYCNSLYDKDYPNCTYVQSYPNGEFRYNNPSVGDTYDVVNDAFRKPQPHSSWIEDSNYKWIPPIPKPDNKNATWDYTNYVTGEGKWVDKLTNEDI
jgi:hypothetical protein